MRTLFAFFLFALITVSSFAQEGKPYGPIAYRTPEQTIGEDYYVIKLDGSAEYNFLMKIVNGEQATIKADMAGTIIKLMSIKDGIARFKDKDGNDYIIEKNDDIYLRDVIPVLEFEDAKTLLLNKPVWVNSYDLKLGIPKTDPIKTARFSKLIVTDIKYGPMETLPLKIYLKTADGKTGYIYATVSSTNTNLDKEYWFSKNFFTVDPEITYKFSPLVWKQIKAGDTPIGMPSDAVKLIMGQPYKINRTTTKAGTTEQYVYGEENPSYYYFTKDKLTAIQR